MRRVFFANPWHVNHTSLSVFINISLFEHIRAPRHNLRKRPGTAELLNWLSALSEAGALTSLRENTKLAEITRYTLFKNEEDQREVEHLIETWPTSD